MYYIVLTFIMLVVAYRITLGLGYINCKALEKNLGFIFKPITIKPKIITGFAEQWGKFLGWFPIGHKYKLSLIVIILLPLHLLMYLSILLYFIVVVLSICTNNEALKLLAYEKIGFYTVMFSLLISAITIIFGYWASLWKKEKISFKNNNEAIKTLNSKLKRIKSQNWYYPLWEKLMKISIFSDDEKGTYCFRRSQIPAIKELVKKSSKSAVVNFDFNNNDSCSFVVVDITSNEEVFRGLIQKDA